MIIQLLKKKMNIQTPSLPSSLYSLPQEAKLSASINGLPFPIF